MTFAPFGNIDLQPMYDFLKVLNIEQLFKFESGKFQYKLHFNLLPTSIGGYFLADPFVNRHNYGLRSRTSNQPTRLVRHSQYAEKSIQVYGKTMWEQIPSDIKQSPSFSIFKRAYKTLLLSSSA